MLEKKESKIEKWLDDRYDISPLKNLLLHKKVPVHKFSFFYYLGGITLFLFIVQVITGILLLMYYKPGEDSAYESVRFIVTEVNFGWLFRNVHNWSANLMILFAFQLSKVSYVVAAREVSIVFSTLFGIFWLKEEHAYQKFVGAPLIALGFRY